jgi:hypothetical protein
MRLGFSWQAQRDFKTTDRIAVMLWVRGESVSRAALPSVAVAVAAS